MPVALLVTQPRNLKLDRPDVLPFLLVRLVSHRVLELACLLAHCFVPSLHVLAPRSHRELTYRQIRVLDRSDVLPFLLVRLVSHRVGTPPRSLLCAQPPRTGVTISPRVNVSSNQSARRSQNTNQRTLPTGQAAAPVLLLMPESALEAHERVTPDLERTGLCIICQDEEATMAAVDCGYAHSRTLCCR
jgi:hypothetical protein